MTTNTVTERCHRFIRTSTLQLVVGSFLRLALGACQNTLVLLIVLRLGHLHRILLLSKLLLHLPQWTIRPNLSGRQRLDLLGLHLFDHVRVILEIE